MATITSSSTTAQITAAFLDNCGWFEDDDADMARRFVTVCTAMLSRGITEIEFGGERTEYTPSVLRELAADAKLFISGKATVATGGAGVKFTSFEDFRS